MNSLNPHDEEQTRTADRFPIVNLGRFRRAGPMILKLIKLGRADADVGLEFLSLLWPDLDRDLVTRADVRPGAGSGQCPHWPLSASKN